MKGREKDVRGLREGGSPMDRMGGRNDGGKRQGRVGKERISRENRMINSETTKKKG